MKTDFSAAVVFHSVPLPILKSLYLHWLHRKAWGWGGCPCQNSGSHWSPRALHLLTFRQSL